MHVIVCNQIRQVKGYISIMLCTVYKSIRKPQTYLFIAKRDDFTPVPDELLNRFGQPQLVSIINLKETTKLALADPLSVQKSIMKDGYYLQLPPTPIDYLQENRTWQEEQEELKGNNQ